MNKISVLSSRLGAGWMAVAALFFAITGAFVKIGAHDFSYMELVFWRMLFTLILIGVPALIRRERFVSANLTYHLLRSIIGFVALLMSFYALSNLPLATAASLACTSSLFLALLSIIFLRKKLSRQSFFGLILGFGGILLLLHPTLEGEKWLGGLVGLAGGLVSGWAYLTVRELGKRGEKSWLTVVFYFALTASILGALLITLSDSWHVVTPSNIWPLLGIGFSATIAQLSMTYAHKVDRKMLAGNLYYCSVAISALLGYFLWGETLNIEMLLAIGIIVISCIIAK